MPYLILKFLHVGSMFVGTALAIGPIVLFVLILRSGDRVAIRRAFRFAESISRAGGVSYGLGVIFGIATALNGGIPLTTTWLVAAYALLGLLVANNLYADRWMRQVHLAAEKAGEEPAAPDLDRWRAASSPLWSLVGLMLLTLALVFVMVVKPTI